MTILGKWSVAELKDLVKAKDYDVKQVQDARNLGQADAAWDADWAAFKSRYNDARTSAMLRIGEAGALLTVSDSVIPAQEQYEGILRALTKTPGRYTDKDFQGLHNRLVTFLGHPIDFSEQPQPKAGTDTDLDAYRGADSAVKAVEAAAKGTREAATSKTAMTIAGGAVLALAVLVGVNAAVRR